MAGACRWLGHVADRVVALERRVPLLATREPSSTPPVVPGAAPALAKAGVGGFFFPFPFPRSCESFGDGVKPALGNTIRGKKTITCETNHLKGLGVFTRPHLSNYHINIYIYI